MGSYEVDPTVLYALEREGFVSRTFRRLDRERQGAVVTAVMVEAYRAGPDAIAIKKVAERAGVAVGSLYQYFRDRDAMLDFAVELVVRTLVGQFDASRSYLEAMPFAEALAAYLSFGIEWSSGQVDFMKFFAAAAYGGAVDAASPRLRERLVKPIAESMLGIVRSLVAAATARGELRPDCDVERVSRLVNTFLIAVGDQKSID
jgi:AcrR family transcriptional regulator